MLQLLQHVPRQNTVATELCSPLHNFQKGTLCFAADDGHIFEIDDEPPPRNRFQNLIAVSREFGNPGLNHLSFQNEATLG